MNLLKQMRFRDLIRNSTVLSAPGIISIFISLLSIPIHLNQAGSENYGNYIIFHFILMFSVNLNFGIGKSTVISINNIPNKKKEISFKALSYTTNISLIILILIIFLYLLKKYLIFDYSEFYKFTLYLLFGSIISIFFISLEGILQGNRKFKLLSFFNLFFYSFSLSIPSILLIYKNFNLENLIFISILIKLISILMMIIIVKYYNLIKKSDNRILANNLKKNARWITLNSLLIQLYDLFDKYLIKIFLGPIAVATYSIPQQLSGKLSIISKSFSAFLLPNLSKKKIDNLSFNFSLKIFIKFIPIVIFLMIPIYPILLKFWLGVSYNDTILNLTKIFSLSVIYSCASHILITKFEATKTLNRNLKIEFFLMPFFLITLYFLTSENFSLLLIGNLILIKELILLFLRLKLLNLKIQRNNSLYLYPIYFLIMLILSFYNYYLYYLMLLPLILNLFRNND